MPFGDKTGPLGQGARTGRGRGRGYCAGDATPGSLNQAQGAGLGRGRRGGLGWRNQFRAAGFAAGETPIAVAPASADRQQEVAALKAAVGALVTTLGEVQRRVEGLEEEPKTE